MMACDRRDLPTGPWGVLAPQFNGETLTAAFPAQKSMLRARRGLWSASFGPGLDASTLCSAYLSVAGDIRLQSVELKSRSEPGPLATFRGLMIAYMLKAAPTPNVSE